MSQRFKLVDTKRKIFRLSLDRKKSMLAGESIVKKIMQRVRKGEKLKAILKKLEETI